MGHVVERPRRADKEQGVGSGARGEVGAAAVRALLLRGRMVIGTVRSREQITEVATHIPRVSGVIVLELSDALQTADALMAAFDGPHADGINGGYIKAADAVTLCSP